MGMFLQAVCHCLTEEIFSIPGWKRGYFWWRRTWDHVVKWCWWAHVAKFKGSWTSGNLKMLELVARIVSTVWRWSINCGAVFGLHSSVGCGTFLVPRCQMVPEDFSHWRGERSGPVGEGWLVRSYWYGFIPSSLPLKSYMLWLYGVSGQPVDRIKPKGSAYTSLCQRKNYSASSHLPTLPYVPDTTPTSTQLSCKTGALLPLPGLWGNFQGLESVSSPFQSCPTTPMPCL